jgi:ankyrin repeat protein
VYGESALNRSAGIGQMNCMKLLVQNGADVNCQTNHGLTQLMLSMNWGNLTTAQYLLEQEADVHYRISKEDYLKNQDALYCAMRMFATDRTPGAAFAILCCNTNTKNVLIDYALTTAIRDSHTQTYSHVQSYIDEYHRILDLNTCQ